MTTRAVALWLLATTVGMILGVALVLHYADRIDGYTFTVHKPGTLKARSEMSAHETCGVCFSTATNSTFFTTCCRTAVREQESRCPRCGAVVTARTLRERWTMATAKRGAAQ